MVPLGGALGPRNPRAGSGPSTALVFPRFAFVRAPSRTPPRPRPRTAHAAPEAVARLSVVDSGALQVLLQPVSYAGATHGAVLKSCVIGPQRPE